MVGLGLLDLFAAARAAELVVLRIGVSEADFGFEVPVAAENPGITVGYAGTDDPALVAVVGEFREVGAQKRDAVFEPADVVLTA